MWKTSKQRREKKREEKRDWEKAEKVNKCQWERQGERERGREREKKKNTYIYIEWERERKHKKLEIKKVSEWERERDKEIQKERRVEGGRAGGDWVGVNRETKGLKDGVQQKRSNPPASMKATALLPLHDKNSPLSHKNDGIHNGGLEAVLARPVPKMGKTWAQEWPRQTKPKKGQFMNFSQGHSGTKFNVNRASFPKENTRIHKNGRNSWTFRFGPFFGLVCRGDSWRARVAEKGELGPKPAEVRNTCTRQKYQANNRMTRQWQGSKESIQHYRGNPRFSQVWNLYGVYPFRTYGVYPFPLFAQGNGIHHSCLPKEIGIHHSLFCSVASGSGNRPREEGCHGGGVYSFFPGMKNQFWQKNYYQRILQRNSELKNNFMQERWTKIIRAKNLVRCVSKNSNKTTKSEFGISPTNADRRETKNQIRWTGRRVFRTNNCKNILDIKLRRNSQIWTENIKQKTPLLRGWTRITPPKPPMRNRQHFPCMQPM